MSNQNEAELQRCLAERQEEISHVQQILQNKVHQLQEVKRCFSCDARSQRERPCSPHVCGVCGVQEAELARLEDLQTSQRRLDLEREEDESDKDR